MPTWRLALGSDIIIPMRDRLRGILTDALTITPFRSDRLAGLPALMRPMFRFHLNGGGIWPGRRCS